MEVIPHAGTRPDAAAEVIALLAESGKLGVEVADVTGFVLNRLQYALFSEAARLVEEGVASAEAVDTITRTTFGYRLPFFGPFAIADMAGLDVYAFCYRSLSEGYPDRFAAPAALTERVEDGALGSRAGEASSRRRPSSFRLWSPIATRAYAAMSRLLAELGDAPVAVLNSSPAGRRLRLPAGAAVAHFVEDCAGSFRNPLDTLGAHPE